MSLLSRDGWLWSSLFFLRSFALPLYLYYFFAYLLANHHSNRVWWLIWYYRRGYKEGLASGLFQKLMMSGSCSVNLAETVICGLWSSSVRCVMSKSGFELITHYIFSLSLSTPTASPVPGTDDDFWSNFIVAGGFPRCLSASGVPPLF